MVTPEQLKEWRVEATCSLRGCNCKSPWDKKIVSLIDEVERLRTDDNWNGWVCENHPHTSWDGGAGCACGGAGMWLIDAYKNLEAEVERLRNEHKFASMAAENAFQAEIYADFLKHVQDGIDACRELSKSEMKRLKVMRGEKVDDD